jgi:hypothetical protein
MRHCSPAASKGDIFIESARGRFHRVATVAEKHWRRLNGYELLARVIAGVKFVDGVELNPKAKAA